MKPFRWNAEKNEVLAAERPHGFVHALHEFVAAVRRGDGVDHAKGVVHAMDDGSAILQYREG